jgi:hypothetical protein
MSILKGFYDSIFGKPSKFKLGELVDIIDEYTVDNQEVVGAEIVTLDDSGIEVKYGLKLNLDNGVQYFRNISESKLSSKRVNRLDKIGDILNG